MQVVMAEALIAAAGQRVGAATGISPGSEMQQQKHMWGMA
jgi:pheromone shutdown protein TraB